MILAVLKVLGAMLRAWPRQANEMVIQSEKRDYCDAQQNLVYHLS